MIDKAILHEAASETRRMNKVADIIITTLEELKGKGIPDRNTRGILIVAEEVRDEIAQLERRIYTAVDSDENLMEIIEEKLDGVLDGTQAFRETLDIFRFHFYNINDESDDILERAYTYAKSLYVIAVGVEEIIETARYV